MELLELGILQTTKTLFCEKIYHGEEAALEKKLSTLLGLTTTLFFMGAPPYGYTAGVRPI